MVVPVNLALSVVPNVQHGAQSATGPDPVSRPDGLDRTLSVLGLHQRAFRSTAVAAGPQALDVLRGVGAEQLGLAAVGPAHHRAARRAHHLGLGAVGVQAAGPCDARRGRVAQGGRDDPYPVRGLARHAGRPVHMVVHVLGARVGLACATARQQQPPAAADDGRRHLVGQGLPARFGEGARVHDQPVGRPARNKTAIIHDLSMLDRTPGSSRRPCRCRTPDWPRSPTPACRCGAPRVRCALSRGQAGQ